MDTAYNNCYAVIFAGGVGSRMKGASIPKQFLELGGKSIIAHTLEHFEKHPRIAGIVVVSVASGISRMKEIVSAEGFKKVLDIVPGGQTGQDSIFEGLARLARHDAVNDSSVVLVHDGVRPLIDGETIDACIESVITRGCTATVAPAGETIIEEENGVVTRVVDRSKCKLARAPQAFMFKDLYSAQLDARAKGRHDYIDSISLMSDYGYVIHTIEGPVDNIKITTPRDFYSYKGFVDYKEMKQLWGDC
ncbi:IspD/TarI family cytidylyltransferase [Collinsella sp. LCP19S3_H3]|uniref:IspD/TarI family cytidylyltransferase n=1 Tax=Collinsella sp. LCP19S3_H3 TaxID=3438768 RepID=UPI003F9084AC